MLMKFVGSGQWLTSLGSVLLLVGLGWDGFLHQIDLTLAEREGVFSLTNPGHILLGVGIIVNVVGIVTFLIERAYRARQLSPVQRAFLVAGAFGLIGLCIVSFWMTAGSSTLIGHRHTDAHSH